MSAIMSGYASTLLLGTKDEGNGVVGPKILDANGSELEGKGKTEAERKRDELVMSMAKMTETTIGHLADFIEILQK